MLAYPGTVAPLSQEGLDMLLLKSSAVSCHQGPPPGVIPVRWEAKLWGSSGNTRSHPTAQHCPCWEHSSSYVAFPWTLPVSCLCHVRSSVHDGLVYSILSQIAQWLLFVDGLMSLSIFLYLWNQGEELLAQLGSTVSEESCLTLA